MSCLQSITGKMNELTSRVPCSGVSRDVPRKESSCPMQYSAYSVPLSFAIPPFYFSMTSHYLIIVALVHSLVTVLWMTSESESMTELSVRASVREVSTKKSTVCTGGWGAGAISNSQVTTTRSRMLLLVGKKGQQLKRGGQEQENETQRCLVEQQHGCLSP